MQMHRAGSKPDWQDIPPGRRNGWQRLAARTNGSVSPGNIITMIGFGVVLYAAVRLTQNHSYVTALWLFAVGRLCDLLDGYVAERTATKGPVGEFLDVTADKLATLAVILAFYAVHITNWWIITLLLVPQVLTAVIKLVWAPHTELKPTRIGKIGMALVWVSLLVLVLSQALDALRLAANILAVLTAVLGFAANIDYYRAARTK